jgi:putative phosphoesterase
MKVAILSDIHANSVALERVLAEVREADARQLVLLGDYVGYYYRPAEVIRELRRWDCQAILGNHDRFALAARSDPQVLDDYRVRYGSGLDVALEQLSGEDWAWLESLPLQQTIEVGKWRVHLAHGAPFDDDAYIYPDAPAERLLQAGAGIDSDTVWFGHTHWPFQSLGRPTLLNPGSVGQPRDIGGMASWALFHVDTGAVSLRRTEFPTHALQAECRRRDSQHSRNSQVLVRKRLQVRGKA